MIHGLKCRVVCELRRSFFSHLFPELQNNEGTTQKYNVRPIYGDKNDDLHTSNPCLTRSVTLCRCHNLLLMTSQIHHMTQHDWHQHKYQLWANIFMRWMPVEKPDPRMLEPTLVAHYFGNVLITRPWHFRQNRLAPAERYHTLATTASRFWAGRILHWAVYTWH